MPPQIYNNKIILQNNWEQRKKYFCCKTQKIMWINANISEKSINFAIDSRKLHLAVSNLLSKYRYFHTSDTGQQLS